MPISTTTWQFLGPDREEAAMEQRLSLITLGVRDVSRARAFYEALGWHLDGGVDDESDQVAFFQAAGIILALWDRGKLERDSGVVDGGGWGGVTLAHNVRSPEEVDAVLAEARDAGATIARSGAPTFWGGYSGVFIDPDGHPWEVAHNPGWVVHEDGRTTLS
jgi:catechol 2,3-dioxygenase-like lactoylglutathione lyase family enzyme